MPFNAFITHRPASKAYPRRKSLRGLSLASVSDVFPTSVRLHRWTLGFREFTFSPIVQALQSLSLHAFCCSPL